MLFLISTGISYVLDHQRNRGSGVCPPPREAHFNRNEKIAVIFFKGEFPEAQIEI